MARPSSVSSTLRLAARALVGLARGLGLAGEVLLTECAAEQRAQVEAGVALGCVFVNAFEACLNQPIVLRRFMFQSIHFG